MTILRPVCGYSFDASAVQLPPTPEDDGIWLIDLQNGGEKFILSIKDLYDFIGKENYPKYGIYWMNHFFWNTTGSRFSFLLRWKTKITDEKHTLVGCLSAGLEGSPIRWVARTRASHVAWQNENQVSVWTRPSNAYMLYEDGGSKEPQLQWAAPDGHQVYIPTTNREWLVTDTYPFGEERTQVLYMHHVPSGTTKVLGRFPQPDMYRGAVRCDLHPRVSPDGRLVCFDSAHAHDGRQMYVYDISQIIEN
jgi:hypothetical protein